MKENWLIVTTTNQSLEPTAPHKAPSVGVAKLLQDVEKSYDNHEKSPSMY